MGLILLWSSPRKRSTFCFRYVREEWNKKSYRLQTSNSARWPAPITGLCICVENYTHCVEKEKQQLPVHYGSYRMYSIITSQYNTIWAHVLNTGYPEQGLTLRLTSSPDIITLSGNGSVCVCECVCISVNLLPLSLDGLLLLLQPPPHLLLQPVAALLVLGDRWLRSVQLVQQLEDDRKTMHFPAGWFQTEAC